MRAGGVAGGCSVDGSGEGPPGRGVVGTDLLCERLREGEGSSGRGVINSASLSGRLEVDDDSTRGLAVDCSCSLERGVRSVGSGMFEGTEGTDGGALLNRLSGMDNDGLEAAGSDASAEGSCVTDVFNGN